MATTALRNSGWSVTPHGAVAYSRETARTATPSSASSAPTAQASIASGSPRLAPSPRYARTRPAAGATLAHDPSIDSD